MSYVVVWEGVLLCPLEVLPLARCSAACRPPHMGAEAIPNLTLITNRRQKVQHKDAARTSNIQAALAAAQQHSVNL